MRRWILWINLLLGAVFLAAFAYGAKGYSDARHAAPELKARAAALAAAGRGPDSIDPENLRILILVEDPGFAFHKGVDLSNKGAGLTTMTQSLSKRLAFREFRPGFRKIRQTGYAIGLESRLSKSDILTLWLDTVPMGRDADGVWTTGFDTAGEAFFGKPLPGLTREEFIELTAVPIAPGRLSPLRRGPDFDARVQRITRLANGLCEPDAVRDVWLDGCAAGRL
ncbi:MAG TPA: transglycosylase domain-containing protein [Hyphomonas sp.]|nr:transglycosylase domain-containing protein [Hyphomonas sp.]HRX75753.1 transglycosylase domain-containing protein [Hyphomonas sp.]